MLRKQVTFSHYNLVLVPASERHLYDKHVQQKNELNLCNLAPATVGSVRARHASIVVSVVIISPSAALIIRLQPCFSVILLPPHDHKRVSNGKQQAGR